MFSLKLIFYCFMFAGGYLLVISALLDLVHRRLRLSDGIPRLMLEDSSVAWWLVNYVMEFLFYVAIPTIAYTFFYLVMPLAGVRAGMAAALFAFTLGSAPAMMGLSVRVKLPMPFLLFLLLSLLLKLGGCLAIIGYLYSL